MLISDTRELHNLERVSILLIILNQEFKTERHVINMNCGSGIISTINAVTFLSQHIY
jgi:hypothetical protein